MKGLGISPPGGLPLCPACGPAGSHDGAKADLSRAAAAEQLRGDEAISISYRLVGSFMNMFGDGDFGRRGGGTGV